MKYFLIICLLTIKLASCNDDRTAQTTFEDSLKIKCRKMVIERLKDPDSYKSKGWVITRIPYDQFLEGLKKYPHHDQPYMPILLAHKYKAANSFGANLLGEIYFMADTTGAVEVYPTFEDLPYYVRAP